MAGKELRGVQHSDANLFEGRPYILTPAQPEALDSAIAQLFLSYLHRIGARVIVMTAAEHDAAVALTSHLPQLLSTALGCFLAQELPDNARQTAGPGLESMLRLAKSDYGLWQDILITNQIPIIGALDRFIQLLEDLKTHIPSSAGPMFETAATLSSKIVVPTNR
jgi:prephenate dehydrogenase